MSHQVFISHSSIDKSIADAVTAALEQAQIRCWIAPRDILPGESWGGSIISAIELSQIMVIIFSSNSNASKQVMREVERAVQKDVVVVPFRVENIEPSRDMEYFLSATHWLDAVTPEMDNHLKDLVSTIQTLLNKSSETPSPAAPPRLDIQAKPKPRSKLPMLASIVGLLAFIAAGFWFFSGSEDQQENFDKGVEIVKSGDEPSSEESVKEADKPSAEEPSKKQLGDIRLVATKKAIAASQLEVDWSGEAAPKDMIMIAANDAQDSAYLQRVVIKDDQPISITVPDKAGVFEIRYMDAASRTVVARRDLIIELPELSLSAPDELGAGMTMSVDWKAPNNKGDYLAIASVGSADKDYASYAYTTKGSPTSVRLPDQAGDYELRYISTQSDIAWARKAITVLEHSVTLETPDTEIAGREIAIKWTGPANQSDFISVAEQGSEGNSYINYSYAKTGKKTTLRMPETAGAFEIRYISGQAKQIWASNPIEIRKPEVSISAPETAVVGSEIDLDWQGPGNKRDYISVADQGSESNQYHSYKYTKPGAKLKARMPDIAGEYVVRYISGQERHIWAEAPVKATERVETLKSPSQVAAGTKFTVNWTSKGNQGDYLGIYKAGADNKDYESYAYTRNKVKTSLTAPADSGAYEIRYISGQQKQVWGSTTFNVE